MTDISTRKDIELLMRTFYSKMLVDEELAPIFNEVAQIDLEAHIPRLVLFWESILFQTGTYRTNVMEMHIALHHKKNLQKIHFDRWLSYFVETVSENHQGPLAHLAIERAKSIALLMQFKINQLDKLG